MKRVLVIDDDSDVQRLVRLWLNDAGHETAGASDGKTGLDIQRKKPADLIITDIFMPEKEGTELLMEIREEFPQTDVIVISGGGGVEGVDFLDLASKLGAVRVFRKPLKRKEFINSVHKVLA